MSRKAKTVTVSKELVVKDLMRQAKALNIPTASTEKYIDGIAEKVSKWAEARGNVITESDLNTEIAKLVKRYNSDLAFIYENRGKII